MNAGRIAGIAVSGVVGAYAGVWLLLPSIPAYDPSKQNLLFVFGLASNTRAMEYGYEQLRSSDPGTRAQSIEVFRDLLRRNPASPYAWCDLGDALLDSGQTKDAERCFTRAFELGGRVPPVMLRIVNFYCRLPDAERALAISNELLTLSSDYDNIIFGLYTRLRVDTDVLLHRGIGVNIRALNAYLQYALHKNDLTQARATWKRLEEMSAIDRPAATEYVTRMYQSGFRDDSSTAWVRYFGRDQSDYRKTNFVFNGDFERPIARGVFDWNLPSEPYVDTAVDQGSACSGLHALRLSFKGDANPAYEGPWQIVWIAPGSYKFEACVQTENLSSNEGLRFRILSSESPRKVLAETDQVSGTGGWRRIGRHVVVPVGMKALEIRLVRNRSWKFDSAVAGTARVDDVRLSPIGEDGRK